MTQPKTMKVKALDPEQGDFVLINEADFDPEVHEALDADDAETPVEKMSVARLRQALTDKGIEFDPAAKKAELVELHKSAQ